MKINNNLSTYYFSLIVLKNTVKKKVIYCIILYIRMHVYIHKERAQGARKPKLRFVDGMREVLVLSIYLIPISYFVHSKVSNSLCFCLSL